MTNFEYKAFISYKKTEPYKQKMEIIKDSIYKLNTPFNPFNLFVKKHIKITFFTDDENSGLGIVDKKIEEGLKNSEYLIYFANPIAAKSEYIFQELDYWINILHRVDYLIIVFTDGNIGYNLIKKEKDTSFASMLIDWQTTDAISPKLKPFLNKTRTFIDLKKIALDKYSLKNNDYKKEILKLLAFLKGEDANLFEKKYKKRESLSNLIKNSVIITLLLLLSLVALFYSKSQKNLGNAKKNEIIAIKKEKEAKRALIEMQIAQDNEALQRFNDLEKRVIVIKNANADPIILIKQMEDIAIKHKDSIVLKERIKKLK